MISSKHVHGTAPYAARLRLSGLKDSRLEETFQVEVGRDVQHEDGESF